jgi:hypothetical protein
MLGRFQTEVMMHDPNSEAVRGRIASLEKIVAKYRRIETPDHQAKANRFANLLAEARIDLANVEARQR